MTRKVRITKFPHLVLEVGEAEYIDLKRQGLLVPEPVEDKTRRAPAPSVESVSKDKD